jgi:hypothetical protein
MDLYLYLFKVLTNNYVPFSNKLISIKVCYYQSGYGYINELSYIRDVVINVCSVLELDRFKVGEVLEFG